MGAVLDIAHLVTCSDQVSNCEFLVAFKGVFGGYKSNFGGGAGSRQ